MTKQLTTLITILYRLMMLAIIISQMFADKIPYSEFHKRTFALPNLILLPIGVLVLLAIRAVVQKLSITGKTNLILFTAMLIALVSHPAQHLWDNQTF